VTRMQRWFSNLYSIILGSFLYLIGCGGFTLRLECDHCGAIIERSEAAMDWHDKVCAVRNGQIQPD